MALTPLPIDPDLESDEQHPRTLIRHHLLTLALIAAGGAVGASSRYLLSEFLPNLPGEIPWTTMLINVLGALALALLLVTLSPDARYSRPFFGTGLLGGFTTFSAVAVEADQLLRSDQLGSTLLYPFLSIFVSVAVVGMVFSVVRR